MNPAVGGRNPSLSFLAAGNSYVDAQFSLDSFSFKRVRSPVKARMLEVQIRMGSASAVESCQYHFQLCFFVIESLVI